MSKQENIDAEFDAIYAEYENIRLKSPSEEEKTFRMELLYIDILQRVFRCLSDNAGVKLVSVERFSRNDGTAGHMYVPSYVNAAGEKKMATHGYPHKATGLLKMLFGFTSYVESERLEKTDM